MNLIGALVKARDSRLLTRVMIVSGVLGLVFAWRLDRAIKTAYESEWVASEGGLRLPTDKWVGIHAAVGVVSPLLLAGAALLWRRRELGSFTTGVLAWTGGVVALVVGLLAGGAAAARIAAAVGAGKGALTIVLVLDLLALAAVVGLALAIGNLVYGAGVGLASIFKRVFQRQRMNIAAVLALTAALALVGQTSGQAVDSIRSWTPFVFEGDDVSWSSVGAARLMLGLAAALLLAVVIYESGVRLTQVVEGYANPGFARFAWLGSFAAVAGGLLWWLLPFGPGLLLLGVVLLVVAALERPDVGGTMPGPVAPTEAEQNAPEWIAIAPLVALAATSVTATVEAALSGSAGKNALMTAVPALVLAAAAVFLTRRQPIRVMERLEGPRFGVISVGIIAAAIVLLLAGRAWLAALFGLFWLVVLVLYARRLLHRSPQPNAGGEVPPWRASSVPVALGAGLAAFIGLHSDPLDAGRLLGVFTLALIALSFGLLFLHAAVQSTLSFRPPKLLWWFGLSQLPVLTLLVIWWVAVGVAQTQVGPKSLHDVRLVERTASAAPATPPLERAFDQWVRVQADLRRPPAEGPVPLVLVAAHGGGIRAAYWTAVALDCIVGFSADDVDPASLETADEAVRTSTCASRRRTADEQRAAARRIFMASGVSGGAVGLYAYARQLLHTGELGPTSDWVDDRLGDDFASPAVGWALFHDVPNRLLGLHPETGAPCGWKVFAVCLRQNRAAVLEETFDDRWELPATTALLRQSYELRFSPSGQTRENARLLPLLALNATLTGGKARAVISPADLGSWPRADADDPERGRDRLPLAGTVEIRDALCETNDVRLSTAALLAARFPYVTPSGRIAGHCGYEGARRPRDANARCAQEDEERCEGRFVDGGYADNSGLFTLVAVWPSLRALVVEYNVRARAAKKRQIAPVIIELDNHYQASLDASVPSGGSAAESLIPLETGFGGRTAIETYARAAAYRILPSSCTVTVSPSLHPGLIAPLGWELSKAARLDLRAGLTRAHPADETGMRPVRLLRQAQARIAAPSEGRVVIGDDLAGCLPRLPDD